MGSFGPRAWNYAKRQVSWEPTPWRRNVWLVGAAVLLLTGAVLLLFTALGPADSPIEPFHFINIVFGLCFLSWGIGEVVHGRSEPLAVALRMIGFLFVLLMPILSVWTLFTLA